MQRQPAPLAGVTYAQEASMFIPKPTARLRPAKDEDHIGPGVMVFGPYVPGGRSGYTFAQVGAMAIVDEAPDSEGWFRVISTTGTGVILNRERVLVLVDPTDTQEV